MNVLQSVAENPLVHRLGYGLVHFLWEGVLIGAVLGLALLLLRGRPAARHAAAWLALAAMAAAVPLTVWLVPASSAAPLRALAGFALHGQRAGVALADVGRLVPGHTSAELLDPAESTGPNTPDAGRGGILSGPASFAEVSARTEPARAANVGAIGPAIGPWMPGVVAAWATGAALLSVWRLLGWFAVRRLCRQGVETVSAEIRAALDRLVKRMRVRPAIRLLESTLAEVPAVVGWLRPAILLPVGIVTGLSTREIELILAHELAHIRRSDYLANLIQKAIETCLFYHPAVWWVSRHIRVERENCCDDAVVAITGERLHYARALARLEEFRGGRRAPRPAIAADNGSLLGRVRRILGLPQKRRHGATAGAVGGGAALTVMAALVGFAALAGQLTPPAAADPATQATGKADAAGRPEHIGQRDPEPASPATAAPRVVDVFPQDGARNVDPVTEIRLRFDRPMDPSRANLAWDSRDRLGYRLAGPMRYDERTRTFSLPLHLTPGGVHRITAGSVDRDGPLRPEGFASVEDVPAKPFSWSFTTSDRGNVAGAEPPRVTSVDPPPDTQQALLTPLRVTFDRPMDPSSYGVTGPVPADGREPELLNHPDYDPASRTFALLLKLPPDWNGDVRLVGFRSAEGAAVTPVTLPYRTRRELLAPSLRARLERAATDSTGLVRFLERVRAARRDRPGLREDVITTLTSGPGVPGWHRRYSTSGATFAIRDDRHFYAEIDEIMGLPFQIGCDGETCWFRREGEFSTLPVNEVAEKNLLVGDPFGASSRAKPSEIIRNRKLEDLGLTNALGHPCRRIRSWDVQLFASEFVTSPVDWFIDVESLLPVRIDIGTYTMDFTHPHLGEPIPDDLFRRRADPRIREAQAEPLAEGYTRRFLNVIDGSNGRMTVRWGSKGPGGTSSSGLN
jgi:beta-lactamase regulating signal transducer with metallopeptidase domain